tara:strand:+ start:6787 stop:8391 length:1605 start_codon:yes stop_codon:yes gene_type:complete
MGNQNSKNNTNSNKNNENDNDIDNMKFENVVSYVAAKFITQSNFSDLEQLHETDYCNKLVILTSKVLQQHLNDMEIEYLDQRTKQGVEVNKLKKEKILYLDKNKLSTLDIPSKFKKKRMCIAIARFYVRIAHLFAAIATTINPRYIYIDDDGIEKNVSFKKRNLIPKNKKIITKYINLCNTRINALKPIQNNENGIIIKSKNCNMNKKINSFIDNVQVPIPSIETKNLKDEHGIPELEMLYYDDYDLNDGTYKGMTDAGKKIYLNDVEKFYIAFTGGQLFPNHIGIKIKNIPNVDKNQIINFLQNHTRDKIIFVDFKEPIWYFKFGKKDTKQKLLKENITFNQIQLEIESWDINKFSDISLKDFHNQELCKDLKSPWKKSYKGNPNDKLFKEYAEHIKNMISNSRKMEKSLLIIIKQLFSFWVDPKKQEKILTVNPKLNNTLLDKLTNDAREDIIKLYIMCEEDFQKGLVLFEGIVKSKMIETSQRRIKIFENKVDEIVDTNTIPNINPTPTISRQVQQSAGKKKNKRIKRKKK